ncbi:hypothetical protein RQP46_008762 [Phenoliferia psychrophenolica]
MKVDVARPAKGVPRSSSHHHSNASPSSAKKRKASENEGLDLPHSPSPAAEAVSASTTEDLKLHDTPLSEGKSAVEGAFSFESGGPAWPSTSGGGASGSRETATKASGASTEGEEIHDGEEDLEDMMGDWDEEDFGPVEDSDSDDSDAEEATPAAAKGKGKAASSGEEKKKKLPRGEVGKRRAERQRLQALRPKRDLLEGDEELLRKFKKNNPYADAFIELIDKLNAVVRDDCRRLKKRKALAFRSEELILNSDPIKLRNHQIATFSQPTQSLLLDVWHGKPVDWDKEPENDPDDYDPAQYFKTGPNAFQVGGPGVVDMDKAFNKGMKRKRDDGGEEEYDGRLLRAEEGEPVYNKPRRGDYIGTTHAIDALVARTKQHRNPNKKHFTVEDRFFLGTRGVPIPDDSGLKSDRRVRRQYAARVIRLTRYKREDYSPHFGLSIESALIELFKTGRGREYLEFQKERAVEKGEAWAPRTIGDGPVPCNDAFPCERYRKKQMSRHRLRNLDLIFGEGKILPVAPQAQYGGPVNAIVTFPGFDHLFPYTNVVLNATAWNDLGKVPEIKFRLDRITFKGTISVPSGDATPREWAEVDASVLLGENGMARWRSWTISLGGALASGKFPGTTIEIDGEMAKSLECEGANFPKRGEWYAFRWNARKAKVVELGFIVKLARKSPTLFLAEKWAAADCISVTPHPSHPLRALMGVHLKGDLFLSRDDSSPSKFTATLVEGDFRSTAFDIGDVVVNGANDKTRRRNLASIVKNVALFEAELATRKIT